MALIPERRTGPGSMGVEKCLNDGVEQGRVSRAGAEKALAAVRRIMEENPGVSEGAAMSRAAEELRIKAAQQKRQVAMQGLAVNRMLQDVEAHPDGVAAGARGIFARDISGKGSQFNVEGRAQAVRGILHGMMADALDAYRSKNLGLTRDTLGLTRFVRELYGEATGDGVAGAAARGWTQATDYAVDRFNAAGGALAKKQAWRLPQTWDRDAVKARGPDAFIDYMEKATADGRLRIWDWEADAPVDALRRAEIISQAYQRITDPFADMIPGQTGSTKLANSRDQRRAFEWTSADAWLDFNRTYGKGDAGIWDAITGHVDGMAHDIAMLERLGPNPAAAARLLIDTAKKAGVEGYGLLRLEASWDYISGRATSPAVDWIAKLGGGVRAWLSAAQLGSAVFSSITDFSTLRATAAWNGLSRNGVMGEYLSLLNPANHADRKLAVRAGLIADGWAQRARAAQRTTMEEIGQTLPNRMASFILRASGMEAHTSAAKWAFGMEFLGHLADQSAKEFGALDAPLRRTMERYGLDAASWDLIRSRGVYKEDGMEIVFPEQLLRQQGGEGLDRAGQEAATRLLEMINTERGFAVIEPGIAEKAMVMGQSRPGTIEGEFFRSSMQYKAFPISMMSRHLVRGMESYRAGDHGRYMAALLVSLTAMGGLAVQLKEVAKGKDPRDMTDWKFWGASFLQGGGAGIVGDFLGASLSRADQSFYATVFGGPTGGLLDDLSKLSGGNLSATAEGKDTNFGRELARFARRNTPGTSLWYTRLALDRMLWDRLQELTDRDAGRSFRRMEDRARKETKQEFWWKPGNALPSRAPGLGAP
jgi:hypothetical protein